MRRVPDRQTTEMLKNATSTTAPSPVILAPLCLVRFSICWTVALLLAVAAMPLLGCMGAGGIATAGSGHGFDKVEITLLEHGKPDPTDAAVAGYLFKPAGSGPFPAIILMHGCDGLEWERAQQASWQLLKDCAERYVAHGYVALILDSFAPRGITNICGNALKVTPQRRTWDAYSAATYLVSLGYVDRRRLVLEGDSHGGWTTLVALEGGWHALEHFAAGIAWYPYCPSSGTFVAPLLIMIGDADDWTPADRCKAMVERLRIQGNESSIVLKTFPGATHAYDFPYAERINAQGHHMAYDRNATTESWQAIGIFLDRYVGGAWPEQ
jgi:dienelactone hydrolase